MDENNFLLYITRLNRWWMIVREKPFRQMTKYLYKKKKIVWNIIKKNLTQVMGGLIPSCIEIAQLICSIDNDSSIIGVHDCISRSKATHIQIVKNMTRWKRTKKIWESNKFGEMSIRQKLLLEPKKSNWVIDVLRKLDFSSNIFFLPDHRSDFSILPSCVDKNVDIWCRSPNSFIVNICCCCSACQIIQCVCCKWRKEGVLSLIEKNCEIDRKNF